MACIDDDSMIGVKSVHVLKTKREVISSKFVLGVFNSKLLNWFFRFENFHMVGKPLAEVKLIYVERLPLLNNGNSSEIIRRVTDILSKKKENPSADTSTLEKEIDQLVYQLYELTPEEIAIIEESIK